MKQLHQTKPLAKRYDNFMIDEKDTLFHVFNGSTHPRHKLRIQLVIPKQLVGEILSWTHESNISGSHLGLEKTLDKILKRYYWKNVYRDTRFYIQSCASCGTRKKAGTQKAPLQPYPASHPWQRVNLDLVGPFPESRKEGNKYALCIVDSFTKFAVIKPLRKVTAEQVSRLFVEEIVCRYGAPKTIVTDQGPQFKSQLFQEIARIVNTTAVTTTAYNPKANGLVERINQTLCTSLSMYVAQRQTDWDTFIPGFLFAYNTSLHPSIKETPFFMNFGRDAVLPCDASLKKTWSEVSPQTYKEELLENLRTAHQQAIYFIQKAAIQMKERYDRKAEDTKFHEGDLVFVRNPPTKQEEKSLNRRFQHHNHGPFRLGERTSAVNFHLMTKENEPLNKQVHVDRLKKYIDMMDGPEYLIPQEPEGNEVEDQPVPRDGKRQTKHKITGEKVTHNPEDVDSKGEKKETNKKPKSIEEAPTSAPNEPSNNTTTNEEMKHSGEEEEESNVYEAEYIVRHRYKKDRTEYLVHWAPPYDDVSFRSWEPYENCGTELLEEYEAKNRKRQKKKKVNVINPRRWDRRTNASWEWTVSSTMMSLLMLITCVVLGAAKQPELGTIYNCELTKKLGIFALPGPIACKKTKWSQPETFSAEVFEYRQIPHKMKIAMCRAEKRTYDCKTNFFGYRDKIMSKIYSVKTNPNDCLKAYQSHVSPYGHLTKIRPETYRFENNAKYVCAWMRDRKATYYEYTMTISNALLYPEDPIVHQPVTNSRCYYNNTFTQKYAHCTPSENPESTVIWKVPNSSTLPKLYHTRGTHKIIKSNDWIFVPDLAIGGGITSTDGNKTFFLDTGYLISTRNIKYIPRQMYKEATDYVAKTKSAAQRDVLAGHIGQNIFFVNSIMAMLQKQICHTQRELNRQQSFLISQFPDISSEYILRKRGYMLRPQGDGFIAHHCEKIKKYTVIWKRKTANKCYNDLVISHQEENYLLRLPEKKIIPLTNPVPCHRKKPLVIKDRYRHHWLLDANDTVTIIKPRHRHTLTAGVKAPKLKKFNTELKHYTDLQIPRISLLQTLADNKDVLEEFGNIREKDESFISGLTQFINTTVMALSLGGGALVTAIGEAIKTDLDGSAEIIEVTGEASGNIISATGTALSTFLDVTGPLALGLTLILASYLFIKLVYPKLSRTLLKKKTAAKDKKEKDDIEIICMEPINKPTNNYTLEGQLTEDHHVDEQKKMMPTSSPTSITLSKSLQTMMVLAMLLALAWAETKQPNMRCNKWNERNVTSQALEHMSILTRRGEYHVKYHHAKGVPPKIAYFYYKIAQERKNKTGSYFSPNDGWKCSTTFLVQICQERFYKPNTCILHNGSIVTADRRSNNKYTLWWKENYIFLGRNYWEKLPEEIFRLKSLVEGKYLCMDPSQGIIASNNPLLNCLFYQEQVTKPRVKHLTRIYNTYERRPLSYNTKGQQRRVKNANPNHKSIRFRMKYTNGLQLEKMNITPYNTWDYTRGRLGEPKEFVEPLFVNEL